jgi:glycosyltransferase involved in cell wall biosynthesis
MIERALANREVEVTTFTTDDNGTGRRLQRQIQEPSANAARRVFRRKWIEFYKFAPGAVPWLWSNVQRFDVVHIHALFSFVSVCAAVIAHLRGIPYVVRPLGTLTVYGIAKRRPWLKRLSLKYIEAPILRNAARVHFTSEIECIEAGRLCMPFRSAIIPLCVDSRDLPDVEITHQGPPGGRRPVTVLFLSRLDPKKNVEGLLHAFAAMDCQLNFSRLIIAGDGSPSYVAGLKSLAQTLGVSDRVEWTGRIDGADKASAFSTADIFVLPSFSENFGIAAVEALSVGLPCVLGQGVAISGDAEGAGAALVVDPEPKSIAKSLALLIGDSELRCRMGTRARDFARSEYSMDAMAEGLIALYSEISMSERNATV